MRTAVRTTPRTTAYASFKRRILAWFDVHGRKLPWRGKRVTPWGVMVSEFMLQQTQVDRVIPKYKAFLRRWPTPRALAEASQADVLRAWSGLGYNRRARHLREAACVIVEQHGGKVPTSREELAALPGIGEYTSGAIVAFAFNKPVALWDTNVRRILLRYYFGGEFADSPVDDTTLTQIAGRTVPKDRAADWYGALMDFGSSICTGRDPSCAACPLKRTCVAAPLIRKGDIPTHRLVRPQARFEGSRRQIRGKILRVLTASVRGRRMTALEGEIGDGAEEAVYALEKEGLVVVRRGSVRLA